MTLKRSSKLRDKQEKWSSRMSKALLLVFQGCMYAHGLAGEREGASPRRYEEERGVGLGAKSEGSIIDSNPSRNVEEKEHKHRTR